MRSYSLEHLAKPVLHRDAVLFHRNESGAMAMAVAHVGEIDARQSYRDEGYPSMLAFCEHVIGLSEQAALKRIRVARVARRHPALFEGLATGKLSLSGVILLAAHLTHANADELIAAATHVPKSELGQLVAKRFPKQDVPAKLEVVPAPPPMRGDQGSPGAPGTAVGDQLSPGTVGSKADEQLSSRTVETAIPRAKVSPLSEARFALQITVSRCMHDKLRYAQELLSHQLPSGDMAEVLDRALDALIVKLEKRKFAATSRPRRATHRVTKSARHIPAHVKREVWLRDGGQCTFVSDAGHRCEERNFLEFDHVEEVARGGKATVAGMRQRCRVHNQLEAERTFGAEFMQAKREEAQRVAREKREAKEREAKEREEQAASAAATRVTAERVATEVRIAAERLAAEARICAQQLAAEQGDAEAQASSRRAKELDVIPWLRALGFRLDDARRAAVHCESFPKASLEARVRDALAFLAPRGTKQDFRPAGHRDGASV